MSAPGQLDLLSYHGPTGDVRAGLEMLRAAVPSRIIFASLDWRHPGWGKAVWSSADSGAVLDREGLYEYAANPLFSSVCFLPGEEVMPERDLRRYHGQLPADFPWISIAHHSVTAPKFSHSMRFGDRSGRVNPHFLDPAWFHDEIWRGKWRSLGERLRLIVLSFPAMLKDAGITPQAFGERLERFLTALPKKAQCAVEIREPEYLTLGYAHALASRGAAHVFSTAPGMPTFAEQARCVPSSPEHVMCFSDPLDGVYKDATQRREQAIAHVLAHADKPAFFLVGDGAEGSTPHTIQRLMAEMVAHLQS